MTANPKPPKKGPWTPASEPPAIIGWYEVKGPGMFDGKITWRFWNGSGWEWCFPMGGREGRTRSTLLVPVAKYFWRGTL